MFKSLVISFVYLTNHLTNIRILSYTLPAFRQCKVSTITSKQLFTKRCSNVIVLLCTAETERVQNLMITLARLILYLITNFIKKKV